MALSKEHIGNAKDGTVSLGTIGGLYILYQLDQHLEELIEVVQANTEAAEKLLEFITN